jgi:hypothetical protein
MCTDTFTEDSNFILRSILTNCFGLIETYRIYEDVNFVKAFNDCFILFRHTLRILVNDGDLVVGVPESTDKVLIDEKKTLSRIPNQ